jgi:hypothetical protein
MHRQWHKLQVLISDIVFAVCTTISLRVTSESRTASVHEPYLEPTGSASTRTTPKLTRSGSFSSLSHKAVCDRGIPNFEREKLLQIVELLDKEGFQVA